MRPDPIHSVIRLSRKLILLAEQGEQSAVDDSCRIFFGLVRDCAYKVDAAARQELKAHLRTTARRLPAMRSR